MRSKVIPPRFPQDSPKIPPKTKPLRLKPPKVHPPPSLKVVIITENDDEGLTEIAWIKRQCRKHAKSAIAFCEFFI